MQLGSPACSPTHLDVSKIVLLYNKLLVMDNAATTLEKDLRDFTKQADVEVHRFLSQPRHPNVLDYDNLIKALNDKCYAIEKMSYVFRCLRTDLQLNVSMPTSQLDILFQPGLSRERGFMKWSEVLKFGPLLQNVLMAGTITKAVQMLSLQQLRISSLSSSCSQYADIQEDVYICSKSSSSSLNKQFVSSANQDQTQYKQANQGMIQNKQENICKENTHHPNTAECHPSQLKENFTPISNKALSTTNRGLYAPDKLLPVLSNKIATQNTALAPPQQHPGSDVVGVQHQKQTSSQLMHFLRIKGKKEIMREYTTFSDRVVFCQHTTSSSTSITLATTSEPLKETATNVLESSCDILTGRSCKLSDNQLKQYAPVFTVKRAESGGYLRYSCIIATETELWDIGDILTEATQSLPFSDVINTIGSRMAAAVPSFQSAGEISNLSLHQTNPSNDSLQNTDRDVLENVLEEINTDCQTLDVGRLQNSSFLSPGNQLGVIPEFQIRKFEEMAVTVSHVVNPGNFCIKHADADLQLEHLSADLEGSSSLADQMCIPDIGTYVMAWFPQQERWCRAEVAKICGMSRDKNAVQVEVRRLDYGDTSCLSLRNIKKLSPAMTSLPFQSIQVALANVSPVDGCSWSQMSVSWFRDMVGNRTLYVRLYAQGEGDLPRVELFMEKGKMGSMRRGASLSMRLAMNGHAKHNKLRNQGCKMSSAQERTKKRESMWNKHLISCYTQNKKCLG
ncbi:hypothetical protein DPEC_G00025650 [Dallia pectoralis]|uniref:Uncharacterized protein n=1 Tax=Dallia pectoralis TaxID=75939 RepID=A0ACC2HHF8_DALPE|nr:hypothetical protein DPEC_G00025650 [Dallia pectoralis]